MTDLIAHDPPLAEAGTPPAEVTAVPSLPTAPEAAPVSPLDLPAPVFAAALSRRSANRAALMQWVRAALVDGVDYGRIHSVGKGRCQYAAQGQADQCPDPRHWSKPSLWKPGAEKIAGMLGVSVHYPTLAEYEQAALHGAEIKTVLLRCELRDAAGRVLADGIGARSLAQDYGDLNKALKMSAKSAHIDATLRLAGLSEVFTQDLEEAKPPGPPPAPDPRPIGADSAEKRRLEARIQELGLDRDRVKDWCRRKWGIEHFADLTGAQYRELLTRLPRFAAAPDAPVRPARATPPGEAELVDPYFGGDVAEQLAG